MNNQSVLAKFYDEDAWQEHAAEQGTLDIRVDTPPEVPQTRWVWPDIYTDEWSAAKREAMGL